jgi:hypothetical protein
MLRLTNFQHPQPVQSNSHIKISFAKLVLTSISLDVLNGILKLGYTIKFLK